MVQRRPAEAGGLAGAVTLLIVRAVGVTDPDVIVSVGVVLGAVPTMITWLVGVWRRRNGHSQP